MGKGKGKKEAKTTTVVKVDEWEAMCTKGALTTGTATTVKGAVALGGQNGLPSSKALGTLITQAQKIGIEEMKKGMSFGWKLTSVVGDDLAVVEKGSYSASHKDGASGCFENMVWPKAYKDENPRSLIIHQNLAPCTRCRTGYKEWAKRDMLTIIVSADGGYDATGKDAIFLFGPQGTVHVF